jgi:putative membrane-bound dehydrogenase-like protein
MKRLHLAFTCIFVSLLTSTLPAAQVKFPTQTFTVPDGFEVEQIAGPPVIERPISGSFDEEGRLYVTDSSGSNDKVDKQVVERPHRIMLLEPADATGHFTKSALFADRMMFPEGCLWFDGSLYVSGPPSIWKLTDTDQDGKAGQRSEWHQGKTLTGCANDLHGPYLGLDGWIYWCKGAFAQQTYERPGRKPLVTRASHIFRAPPDHSSLEPVLTAGMDNPVGVVFNLSGERFMCGTFLMHPEAGKRDGIVHAVYGGVYGKSNDVLDDHKKTGDLMPIMTHLGAAAPCSVIRYESEIFGREYRNNLFVCCFNLHKVTRHVLQGEGATFKTQDSDFLVSDNPDFHPTDVLEDADGSLIVIDTGGWYKLCCPTSQLSKPDVLGAIYRIKRAGAPPINDPRGLKLDWAKSDVNQIVKLLADARPAVRKRALVQLGKAGSAAVPVLTQSFKNMNSPDARAYVVWALTRIQGAPARAEVRSALSDPDALVKQAAIHSGALWRDADALRELMNLLESSSPPLQRAAAEALGRIGDKSTVPALLRVSARPHDRVLEHSVIFALIEINDSSGTAQGLLSEAATERRAALIALDQMDGGGLKVETVAPLLSSTDPMLRETAVWIAGHHPEWGSELAGFFSSRLAAKDRTPAEAEELKGQLAGFAQSKPIQELLGSRLSDDATSIATRQLLLEVISMVSFKEPAVGWIHGVIANLGGEDETLLNPAVAAARVMAMAKTNSSELCAPLLRVAHDQSHSPGLRIEALSALPPGGVTLDSDMLDLLCSNLDPATPVLTRGTAAGVLSKAKLSNQQLIQVADHLKTAGPLETTKLLDAFEQSTNELVGTKLVEGLKGCKSLACIRPDALQKVLARFPASVQEHGRELLASIQVDAAKQSAHLAELMASLGKGDIRRGQAIFNSPRAACSSCHAMGYLGGHAGPDLTTIGQIRTERDLLESIVYPSASFVRSFEPYVVRTKSDDAYSGVLRKDAPEEVILVTGPATEVRIARSDIADMRPGTVSLMPAGLDQQLTHQELADLVAFLKATKWGAK